MLRAGKLRVPNPMRSMNSFLIYLILPAALTPGVYSAYNRNEYQKHKKSYQGSRARPMRKADNTTAICVPIVYTMWDPPHLTTL
jgi:hypothetical protein